MEFMGFRAGQPMAGTKIDVAFLGSCTNARLSDLREAAKIAAGRKVASHVRALVVPVSQAVASAAEREGLDAVFREAGFEWRGAGCSMCLAMNTDRLEGREMRPRPTAISRPAGQSDRPHAVMSPAMVAAAAVAGEVVDAVLVVAPCPLARSGAMTVSSRTLVAGPAIVLPGRRPTPTASCLRAFCAITFDASKRTCSKTIAGFRSQGVAPLTIPCGRTQPCFSSTPTSAADRRANTRRRRFGVAAFRRSSASRSRRSSRGTR